MYIFVKKDMRTLLENPDALTPIRHTNLALNDAGVRGSILVDFPVYVTGKVVMYRGKPEIIISDEKDIQVK